MNKRCKCCGCTHTHTHTHNYVYKTKRGGTNLNCSSSLFINLYKGGLCE